MHVRILMLGDEDVHIPSDLQAQHLIELTLETRDEVRSDAGIGHYKVSDRSLQLAHEATLEKYDVIIIGNNLGRGLPKARALPPEVRDRTMIAWNMYRPGDEAGYSDMGFTHFGNRYNMGQSDELDMAGFIRQVIDELSAPTRRFTDAYDVGQGTPGP